MTQLSQFLMAMDAAGYAGRLLKDEPMAGYVSYGVGGPADLMGTARTLAELVDWVRLARSAGVPYLVLGSGTNVLVSDRGIRGAVFINDCRQFALGEDGILVAESGCVFSELARHAVVQGWAGLEWAVGIPGTIGGAVVGNAGAYGGYIGDVLIDVSLLRRDDAVERVPQAALGYGYRTSDMKREDLCRPRTVVLEARLQLTPGDAHMLGERARQVTEQREAHTPQGACAGSTFVRTQHYPAGFLIEQAGLKGYRLGGAQISDKHANFIMNAGGATASEIAELIAYVQERIWRDFAQRLEPEVQLIGDWPRATAAAMPRLERVGTQ